MTTHELIDAWRFLQKMRAARDAEPQLVARTSMALLTEQLRATLLLALRSRSLTLNE